MKTFTKVVLVLAGVLGSIGLACVIIAFAMGLSMTNIMDMISDGDFTFDFSNGIEISLGGDASSEEQIEDVCEKMEIEFGAGQLEIFYDDVEEIQVKWVNIPDIKVEVNNGTLCIGEKDGVNVHFNTNTDRKLEIIIPRDTQFKQVELEVGAGQANVSGLITEKFDVEVGAGQINVELSGAEDDYNYNIECGVGKVVVGNTSYAGLGTEKTIKNEGATQDIIVECGIGEVKIQFEN